ncbi:MAG: 4Fe-4S binding protein [Thermodesulfobacteriota bacterium]
MNNLARAAHKRASRQLLFWWILPLAVIAGWRYPVLGYFLPLCMIAATGIAVFKGRYWCDWLCPRGGSWDLFLSRISRKSKIPLFFRTAKFRILVIMIFLTVLAIRLPRVWPDLEGVGGVFVTMLTVTTLVGIILGLPTHHRNWCVYCPVGTMANVLGRGKYPLTISAQCNGCRKCDTVCPIQIKRWQYRPENGGPAVVPEWDCLKCGLCVEVCPQKALSFKTN